MFCLPFLQFLHCRTLVLLGAVVLGAVVLGAAFLILYAMVCLQAMRSRRQARSAVARVLLPPPGSRRGGLSGAVITAHGFSVLALLSVGACALALHPTRSSGSQPVYVAAQTRAEATTAAGLLPVSAIEAASEGPTAGPEVRVNPAMDTAALQSALNQAPPGANILFDPGTYNLAATLNVPCRDLHIAGPAGTLPAAILSAGFTNSDVLAYTTGCDHLGSIRYLHFENSGAVYVGGGNNSDFIFEHNLVTHLPSGLSNPGSETGLFFDGSMATTLRNVLIRYNTFGDEHSCTAVFATPKDEGGYCSGIVTSQGENNHLRIEYNNFFHVENGVHFNQLAQWAPGKANSVCIACAVEHNYIANYHRIGIEIQTSTPDDAILIQHNAILDPINSSWGTFAVSMACCQWGHIFATPGHEPGYIFNDNVLVASLPIGKMCPPYGVEFWGNGPQGMNSLVQGTFCNGYTWGFGGGSWAINHNYICGPDFVAKGGYITDQQKQGNPPGRSGNLVSATCVATVSTAPAISPAGGRSAGPQVVTLTDAGLNTGIWYTVDGSTPVPGTGTARYYSQPFSVNGAVTVKAVGMWGAPNQPVSYPAGYGYVPSAVVTASFTPGGAAQPVHRAGNHLPARPQGISVRKVSQG